MCGYRVYGKVRWGGGKVEWKNLGDDGKRAEAVLSFGGQSLTVAFTIEDAVRMIGEKKNEKGRQQLGGRSRCNAAGEADQQSCSHSGTGHCGGRLTAVAYTHLSLSTNEIQK